MNVPTRRILIEGRDIGKMLTDEVISLSVEDHIEEADTASFEITNRKNQWIDHPLLERGNNVEVFLGYGKNPPRVFEGIIAVLEPHFPQDGVPTISVTAYDRSYLMRKKGDADNVFPDRTPNEVVREVARRYRFREDEILTPDEAKGQRFFQQESENDWEFLQNMAKEMGFELFVELGVLSFRKPATKPDLMPGTFEYRKNLLSLDVSLSVEKPVSKVIVRGWDAKEKRSFQVEMDDPHAADRDVLGEQSGSDFLTEGMGDSTKILHDLVAESEEHARSLAAAYFKQKEFQLITANGSCVGDPELRAKRLVRLGGIGRKYSGLYYLTCVTQRLDDGGYICEFEAERNAVSKITVEDRKDVQRLESEGFHLGAGK